MTRSREKDLSHITVSAAVIFRHQYICLCFMFTLILVQPTCSMLPYQCHEKKWSTKRVRCGEGKWKMKNETLDLTQILNWDIWSLIFIRLTLTDICIWRQKKCSPSPSSRDQSHLTGLSLRQCVWREKEAEDNGWNGKLEPIGYFLTTLFIYYVLLIVFICISVFWISSGFKACNLQRLNCHQTADGSSHVIQISIVLTHTNLRTD